MDILHSDTEFCSEKAIWLKNSLRKKVMSQFCCSPEDHSISGLGVLGIYWVVLQIFNLDDCREDVMKEGSILAAFRLEFVFCM